MDLNELRNQIIDYLISKGEIHAVLYYKLEKRFCNPKSKFNIGKDPLISYLFEMMNKRIIEIIIPEPFKITWEVKNLTALKFLKDGDYYTREFSPLNGGFFNAFNKNNYYFDSRLLDFTKKAETLKRIEFLKRIICKIPKLKNYLIIYYPPGSKPLNIYEPFEGDYIINFQDFQANSYLNRSAKFELLIPLDQQKSDMSIIKNYRTNYMCVYITLIESIHKAIMNINYQKEKYKNYNEIVKDLITKFGYYCLMYVKSDWIDIKPNVYRWESFFNSFDLPFKVIDLSFKNIRFYEGTFEFWIRFHYCIFIKKNYSNLIKHLKNLGYEEFEEENNNDYIAIGVNHDIFEPCPSIEHFYFLNKYLYYYHMFYLFYHCFEYIEETEINNKFKDNDREMYKIFLPVMESFFDVHDDKVSKKLVFNYYTYNSDELELIYNKFLLKNVKNIELKLFKYYLLKYNSMNMKKKSV